MTRQQSIWVKVCGTTSLRDARLSVAAGPTPWGSSSRPVLGGWKFRTPADRRHARGRGGIDRGVRESVADEVADIADRVGLSGVQLHGDETAVQMAEFRRALGQRKIIKALLVSNLRSNRNLQLEGYLDAYAALTPSSSTRVRRSNAAERAFPSTGKMLPGSPHPRQDAADCRRELNSGNVARAIELFQPWGVDVVSGVESAPGTKDETKLREFMSAVRQHG